MANYPLTDVGSEDLFSQFRTKVNLIKDVVNAISEDVGGGVAGLNTFKTVTDGVNVITADSLTSQLKIVGGNNITLNYNNTTKQIEIVGTAVGASIDDTPADGNITIGISSNWAYDHAVGQTANLHTKLGALAQDLDFNSKYAKGIAGIKTAAGLVVMSFDNDWLRINNNNTSSNGIYFGNSTIRIGDTGELQIGDSGGNILQVDSTQFTYNGQRVLSEEIFNEVLFDIPGSIAANEVVAWNGTLSKWVNKTKGEAGIASTTTSVIAGSGLTGGGTLAADRTINADFGTTAGKISEGNHTHTGILADSDNKIVVAQISGTIAGGITYSNGKIIRIEYNYAPSGNNITADYTYNTNGSIATEKWKNGTSGSIFRTMTYNYNADGTLKEIIKS